jgi:hypothetical protein
MATGSRPSKTRWAGVTRASDARPRGRRGGGSGASLGPRNSERVQIVRSHPLAKSARRMGQLVTKVESFSAPTGDSPFDSAQGCSSPGQAVRCWRVMIHGAEDRPPSQNRILDGTPCGNSSLGHRYCRNAEVLRLRRPIRSANRSASLRMTA